MQLHHGITDPAAVQALEEEEAAAEDSLVESLGHQLQEAHVHLQVHSSHVMAQGILNGYQLH